MRLFVGIRVPSPCAQELAKIQARLNPSLGSAYRWVSGQNLHMTVCFVGEVHDSYVDGIIGVLRNVPVVGGEFSPSSLIALPDSRHPKVIALEGEDAGAAQLALGVREALRANGTEFDDKPFLPHVTLGRQRSMIEHSVVNRMLNMAKLENLSFHHDGFELIESRMDAMGSQYVTRMVYSS
ncbi:MAG: RNA 2',3'-cyclic phosphodiesterase [Armatimonadetes bacterium]|nr:RNA 2',3'-cyclic phosphodiesterase [Armatimonadota bacterium]